MENVVKCITLQNNTLVTMPSTVRIEWMVPRWLGVREDVSLSRVKTQGPFIVGTEVKVSYKSAVFKAKIVDNVRGKYFTFLRSPSI